MTFDNASEYDKTPRFEMSSIIDRVWEITWAGRLLCLVLSLDFALLIYLGGGLISIVHADAIPVNFAWVATFIAGYCFVAAFLLPALFHCLVAVFTSFMTFADQPSDEARAGAVLKRALRDENAFLMDYYRTERAKYERREANAKSLADMLASLMVIGGINLVWGNGDLTAPSIVSAFLDYTGMWGEITLSIAVLTVTGVVVQTRLHVRDHYIYHPELAREEEEARRKRLCPESSFP